MFYPSKGYFITLFLEKIVLIYFTPIFVDRRLMKKNLPSRIRGFQNYEETSDRDIKESLTLENFIYRYKNHPFDLLS